MAVFAASTARAQLTVDQLEVAVTPSATGRVISSFVVRNEGKHPTQATITREDWDRAETGENRFVPSGRTPNSCGKSVNVFPSAFRIEPGTAQTIRLAVEGTPVQAKECWDILFVQEVAQRNAPTRSGLQYIFRTGVKIYVVPRGLKRDASITDMSRMSKQRISILFSNSGEVHLAAKGRIELRRLDNSIALQIPIPEFPTLPGAVRRLEVEVPPDVPAGTYIALALIDFGGAEIAAGQLELTFR